MIHWSTPEHSHSPPILIEPVRPQKMQMQMEMDTSQDPYRHPPELNLLTHIEKLRQSLKHRDLENIKLKHENTILKQVILC